MDRGKVDEAEDVIDTLVAESDHAGYTEKKSNSALLYYVAGYGARKIVAKPACPSCAAQLCISNAEANANADAYFTTYFNNGGLIYPCQALSSVVKLM